MSTDKEFEQMLEQQLGFTPVDHAEVARVEDAVRRTVVEKVKEDLPKKQEELAKARTWYVG